MDRNKAIELLAACKPLAEKLTTSNVYNFQLEDLDKADRLSLEGFNQVDKARLLGDLDILNQSGLTEADRQLLGFLAVKLQNEN